MNSIQSVNPASSESGMTDIPMAAPTRTSLLARMRRAAPARPGEQYGAPGNGSSWRISLLTVIVVLAAWTAATHFGYIEPLFLPSPQSVWLQFIDVLTEGFADATLMTHVGWSAMRVFGAFVLAVLTAVPAGVMMGVNRVAPLLAHRVVSVSDFSRPVRPVRPLGDRLRVIRSPFDKPAAQPDRAACAEALRARIGAAPGRFSGAVRPDTLDGA